MSFPLWKRLVLISKIKKRLSAKEIAKEIQDLPTNSYFREVLRFLEENNFCQIDKGRYPYYYIIDRKKLANYLREGEPFKLSEELIKLTTIGYNY